MGGPQATLSYAIHGSAERQVVTLAAMSILHPLIGCAQSWLRLRGERPASKWTC